MVPRRREACLSWFKPTLVGSTVEIGTSDHRMDSCMQLDTGGVPSRHGYLGARQDRTGHAERKDSGDDDCSADAHGFLHGECPGQRIRCLPGRHFRVTWSIVAFQLFHARLQSKSFLFPKCNLCDNCRCLCTGKVRFFVYGKISVFVHCKVLCKLHDAVPEQQNIQLLPEDAYAVNIASGKYHLLPKCSSSTIRCVPTVTLAGALIGRDGELSVLVRLMAEAAGGQGGAVLIEGEPGIGKSALVRAALAADPNLNCEVFWGAGDELGETLPLLPLLEGLRVREPSTNPRLPGARRSSSYCAARSPPIPARTPPRRWRSSCSRLSPSSAPYGRRSWSLTICSGPIRPASPCGGGWPSWRSRCRCC